MRLLVSAGGTGGHIYPALAIIAENQASPAPADVLWVGTAGEMEETLVPRAGIKLETIPGGGLHGVGLKQLLRNGPALVRGWRRARQLLADFRPDALLLTGGYTNGPLALAAWERRVPMLIFLPDIEPGLAIKTLGRLATRIACTAGESRRYLPAEKVVVTGYPVRPGLLPTLDKGEALASFELPADRPTLFCFGGSRGARTINLALLAILPDLLARYQVIHVTGKLDWETVSARADALAPAQRAHYRPYPFLHQEMGLALRAADLVLSRAGAATLGEFPAFGLPAILVPYPFAWRYQKVNADYLAAAGAAVRLNDEMMTSELLPTIQGLLDHPAALDAMRRAARTLDRPDAARRVAELLVQLGG